MCARGEGESHAYVLHIYTHTSIHPSVNIHTYIHTYIHIRTHFVVLRLTFVVVVVCSSFNTTEGSCISLSDECCVVVVAVVAVVAVAVVVVVVLFVCSLLRLCLYLYSSVRSPLRST